LRPGRLVSPHIVSVDRLDTLISNIGIGDEQGSLVQASLDGVPCHSGGCKAFKVGIPDDAIIVVDIGAHLRTEFFDWLRTDKSGRRFVIAFEPNRKLAADHPQHDRLLLLEAAVAVAEKASTAVLHQSRHQGCNSLLPLSQTVNSLTSTSNGALRRCLEQADAADPMTVQIISLAAALRQLLTGHQIAFLKVDAQGGDLDAILSAGSYLQFVRRLQVEVHDFPRGHPRLPYTGQPSKEEIVVALTGRGFILDACRPVSPELNEEDCLFVRADLLLQPAPLSVKDLIQGEIDWDRPKPPGR